MEKPNHPLISILLLGKQIAAKNIFSKFWKHRVRFTFPIRSVILGHFRNTSERINKNSLWIYSKQNCFSAWNAQHHTICAQLVFVCHWICAPHFLIPECWCWFAFSFALVCRFHANAVMYTVSNWMVLTNWMVFISQTHWCVFRCLFLPFYLFI